MEKLTPDLSGVAPRGCAVPLAVLKCIGHKSTPIPSAQKSFDRIWGKPFSRRLTPKQAQLLRCRLLGSLEFTDKHFGVYGYFSLGFASSSKQMCLRNGELQGGKPSRRRMPGPTNDEIVDLSLGILLHEVPQN